jgi:hypothetical protein
MTIVNFVPQVKKKATRREGGISTSTAEISPEAIATSSSLALTMANESTYAIQGKQPIT